MRKEILRKYFEFAKLNLSICVALPHGTFLGERGCESLSRLTEKWFLADCNCCYALIQRRNISKERFNNWGRELDDEPALLSNQSRRLYSKINHWLVSVWKFCKVFPLLDTFDAHRLNNTEDSK
mgnify:CR=1 FL=1